MSDQHNPGPDEIEGIFDNATVEDFMRTTSAVRELVRDPKEHNDPTAFNEFVEEMLRATHVAWAASDTFMSPILVIASETLQRTLVPDSDETMGQFIERGHREAVEMGASWTFIAQRTMVAITLEEPGDYHSPIDDEDRKAAVPEDSWHLGVIWYAERRNGAERHVRSGKFSDNNGKLEDPVEDKLGQGINLFARILAD